MLLVVNQGDKNLSVVDAATGQQVATIDEGVTAVHGHEVATSPNGRVAYVPIYGSAGVGKPGLNGHWERTLREYLGPDRAPASGNRGSMAIKCW